ncbi:MAG: hypothetical protein ABIX37_08890 [Gammaproteobacteria bacterium]
MAEHEVMWIGRRPAAMAPVEHASASEDFAEAVTAACQRCGCDVEDYVAAAGVYGSWLVRFGLGGQRQRLVWNGKDGRLVLEQATTGPDWTELGNQAVTVRDQNHFVTAVLNLLGSDGDGAQT